MVHLAAMSPPSVRIQPPKITWWWDNTFTAYNMPVKISGIFDTGTKLSNNAVIFPLATLQKLSTQPDTVSSATVQADSITNVTSVVAAIKSSLGTKADVTSAQDTAVRHCSHWKTLKVSPVYSLIGAVIAGAVIIFLTMLMIVRERRREIGVFKAIGASNIKITAQFVSEALVLTLLGAVVGVAGGASASNSIAKVLVASSATSATSAATGPGAGGGFARAAGSFRPGRGIGRSIIGGIQNVQTTVGWDILLYGLLGAVIIAMSAAPSPLISSIKSPPSRSNRAE